MKTNLLILLTLLLAACSDQPTQPRTGEDIYYQSCFSCHERGHGGAPIRGNTEQWQPRLEQDEAIILENMRNGINGMPPKGACFDCNDKELQMALEFMLKQP
ncbi:MAG: cytochrome c5 family protein [Kangiellaceae bacterium]|nr:cytochrome c5 family protein [Kangiellaceae bacterium]